MANSISVKIPTANNGRRVTVRINKSLLIAEVIYHLVWSGQHGALSGAD